VIGRFPGAVVALLALLALATAACSTSTSHSAALPPSSTTSTTASAPATTATGVCTRPHPSGQTTQAFLFDGRIRTYQLYVPPAYTGGRAVPVVFNFHAFGSNAREQMVYGNFKPEADQYDFLIVAPDGQVPGDRHFNLTGEPGLQNDVQMVDALLDRIESQFCVDPRRVFSTGMSDGGGMTSALACTMYTRFAAFAPVALQAYRPGCGGNAAIPIEAFKGTADPIVPYNGGVTRCCGHQVVGSAPKAMASWAAHNGCTGYTDTMIGNDVSKRVWTGCRTRGNVIFYRVIGGGHTWPGSIPIGLLGKTTNAISASELIWQFFQAHPLP